MGVNPALSWALSVRRQMPCALCVAAEWECVRVALVHGCNFTITMSIRGYRWGARCESRAAWAQAAGSHANARLSMVSSPCPLGKACSYLMPLVFLSSEVSRGPRCVAGALDRGRARPPRPEEERRGPPTPHRRSVGSGNSGGSPCVFVVVSLPCPGSGGLKAIT